MRSDLTDDDRRFAARLLACRTSAALSRQKLANAAKLSEATIKFLEKGRMKPSADCLSTEWTHDSTQRL